MSAYCIVLNHYGDQLWMKEDLCDSIQHANIKGSNFSFFLFQIYVAHPLLVDYCVNQDMVDAFNANATAYYGTFTTPEETTVPLSTVFLNNSFKSNETQGGCVLKDPPPTHEPNTALLSTILTLGTFLLAYVLKILRNGKFLGKHVSNHAPVQLLLIILYCMCVMVNCSE